MHGGEQLDEGMACESVQGGFDEGTQGESAQSGLDEGMMGESVQVHAGGM